MVYHKNVHTNRVAVIHQLQKSNQLKRVQWAVTNVKQSVNMMWGIATTRLTRNCNVCIINTTVDHLK